LFRMELEGIKIQRRARLSCSYLNGVGSLDVCFRDTTLRTWLGTLQWRVPNRLNPFFHPIARGAAMSFRPLHDRIVVRRTDSEERSAGGIIIPDNAKEKPSEGVVEAVGPGARDDSGKLIKPDVKAGDRVLFGKWSGTEVKLDGNELLIMKESDVMGVITA
jgi:chaperonin GroES